MKHLLIIFTLLLTSVSWSKEVDNKNLIYRDGLWYEKFSNIPFTGKMTGKEQVNIINGKMNGEYLMFNSEGQLIIQNFFIDNVRNGKQVFYNEYGFIESITHYKNDKRNGIETIFNDFGTKLSTQNYKDGLRHGVNEGVVLFKSLEESYKTNCKYKETFKRYYKEDKLYGQEIIENCYLNSKIIANYKNGKELCGTIQYFKKNFIRYKETCDNDKTEFKWYYDNQTLGILNKKYFSKEGNEISEDEFLNQKLSEYEAKSYYVSALYYLRDLRN